MNSKRRSVSTLWVKHLKSPEAKEGMKQNLSTKGTDVVFLRLISILKEQLEELDSSDSSDFDSPGWANKQAFILGRKRQIKEILNLLTIKE